MANTLKGVVNLSLSSRSRRFSLISFAYDTKQTKNYQ
jgi:hypothetical protein